VRGYEGRGRGRRDGGRERGRDGRRERLKEGEWGEREDRVEIDCRRGVGYAGA